MQRGQVGVEQVVFWKRVGHDLVHSKYLTMLCTHAVLSAAVP